jgi:hypothetical protein
VDGWATHHERRLLLLELELRGRVFPSKATAKMATMVVVTTQLMDFK